MHYFTTFLRNVVGTTTICRVPLFLGLIVSLAVVAGPLTAHAKETVVLLHGLGRTSSSMLLLKHHLQNAGYQVVSKRYASTKAPVSDHVAWLENALAECCLGAGVKTHFVTHSLGGIIVRMYLKENHMASLGRVVMLAPPNRGSEVADYLKNWKLYQITMGPSGQELGTGTHSTPNLLGPVDFELGVIAGDASFNPLMSRLIPGPDDGKVAVDRTKVEGMKDFLIVHHSHTFIMNATRVADEVISFLQTGSFTHADILQRRKKGADDGFSDHKQNARTKSKPHA